MNNQINKYIKSLSIIENDTTIFENDKYIIPIYQRAFAWSDRDINKLIEDIKDFDSKNSTNYYLGTLVVHHKDNGNYEVIDGQQRLTALFLLLNALNYNVNSGNLDYECREESHYTLKNLKGLMTSINYEEKQVDKNILDNYKKIVGILDSLDKRKQLNNFKDKLKNVKLYRVIVPPQTDLNHYFEIMNVRGEQLDQTDILKERLMSNIKDAGLRYQFATIWDACQDINGYIQMHFVNISYREILFGKDWNTFNEDYFKAKGNIIILNANAPKTENTTKNTSYTVQEIIELKTFNTENFDNFEDDSKLRFLSTIDFQYFLIHVLKVYIEKNHITFSDKKYNISLDDQKLLQNFDIVFKHGELNGKKIDKEEFANNFIAYLVKCRYLFDKYIIKRDLTKKNQEDDERGAWSLVEMSAKNKKPEYKATIFKNPKKAYKTCEYRNKMNLMLQSCLRVSYTSPKGMHWITELLKWLCENENLKNLSQFEKVTKEILKEEPKKFLKDQNFNMGTSTPHVVLNYLDYLLWEKDTNQDFVFTYRNSVEHWYPQHPSDSCAPWENDDFNHFGNLCLLQSNINSKFSNLSPVSKKGYFDKIKNGSLKLRIMSEKTTDNESWKGKLPYNINNSICAQHEEEMLNILRTDCCIK